MADKAAMAMPANKEKRRGLNEELVMASKVKRTPYQYLQDVFGWRSGIPAVKRILELRASVPAFR